MKADRAGRHSRTALDLSKPGKKIASAANLVVKVVAGIIVWIEDESEAHFMTKGDASLFSVCGGKEQKVSSLGSHASDLCSA